jgi:hypothetical protein
MIPMKSYADDVSELDKRIQDGWANLYSKEKPVLINTQLKKSCLSLVRIMLDMTNVHHDLFLINNAESMKMMNHQKFNKELIDGSQSLLSDFPSLENSIQDTLKDFELLLSMKSDDDRKILSFYLRRTIKSELADMKGRNETTDMFKNGDMYNDSVVKVYQEKYINLTKKYYSWLQSNASM